MVAEATAPRRENVPRHILFYGSHAKNVVPGADCIRAVRYSVRFHREIDRKVYTHVDENFG